MSHPQAITREELDAATDRMSALNKGMFVCEIDHPQSYVGTRPLAEGEFSSLFEDVYTAPGKPTLWLASGVPGATVIIDQERLPNTGGHYHTGGDAGRSEPQTFVLGPVYPQNLEVRSSSPMSGCIIRQTANFSTGGTVVNHIHVGIGGLVEFTGGPGIILTGSTMTHPSNHWGTPRLIAAILALGAAFQQRFGKVIYVNDMSLQGGGLFDHMANWKPPHQTHRDGVVVDINSTSQSPEEQEFFRRAAREAGFFRATLEASPPHWHLQV